MPELPEVETTVRGIAPHVTGKSIRNVTVRQAQLRWPVPEDLGRTLAGSRIRQASRRGKYILLNTGNGHLLVHLGMSGSLRVIPADTPAGPHDHVDIIFDGGQCLRLRDPRRFGAVLWCRDKPEDHELLREFSRLMTFEGIREEDSDES